MNLWICGLLDLILIAGVVIFAIIGYKKGFMKKLISLGGILVILIFSFLYCGQFAEFMISHDMIYPGIFEKIHTGFLTKLEGKNITGDTTVPVFLNEYLGVPKLFANMLGKGVTNDSGELLTAADMAFAAADYIAGIIMNIIAFIILAILIFVVILILKLIADALRTNKLVEVVDGILGILLYLTFYAVGVCVLFWILSLFMRAEWFSTARAWFEVDMQLTTDKFRLSKLVYEGNVLRRLMDLFF
ncbi:MAG: hypothetical protein E7176_00880 [Erysipelotrichaceae bacterium]|nr:hypothetical protein [Erysipelotrichaceae bacterium]